MLCYRSVPKVGAEFSIFATGNAFAKFPLPLILVYFPTYQWAILLFFVLFCLWAQDKCIYLISSYIIDCFIHFISSDKLISGMSAFQLKKKKSCYPFLPRNVSLFIKKKKKEATLPTLTLLKVPKFSRFWGSDSICFDIQRLSFGTTELKSGNPTAKHTAAFCLSKQCRQLVLTCPNSTDDRGQWEVGV